MLEIALRYANAFYLEVEEKNSVEVIKDMEILNTLFQENRFLKKYLLDKKDLSLNNKIIILDKLIKKPLNNLTKSLIRFVDFKGRLEVLILIVFSFTQIDKEKKNLLEVVLIKSKGLNEDFENGFLEIMKKRYNKKIVLKVESRDDFIGGFSFRVGDMFYDYSIKGKLESLKKHLLENK